MLALRDVFKSPNCLKSLRYYCSKRKSSPNVTEKPVLYGDLASPPVRFAMVTASKLGVDVDFHNIDLFRSEQKSEFYSKINPLQKVPALKVGNNVITDSHAIALYLCRRSGDKQLYPDDIMTRAQVDQMLFFNAGTLFPVDNAIFTLFFAGKWSAECDAEQTSRWNSVLDHLNNVLKKRKWLAGHEMMLCDICCATTVSSLRLLIPASERHEQLNEWMRNMQTFSFFKINNEGLKRLKKCVDGIKYQY